jgi:hypothetical protein
VKKEDREKRAEGAGEAEGAEEAKIPYPISYTLHPTPHTPNSAKKSCH